MDKTLKRAWELKDRGEHSEGDRMLAHISAARVAVATLEGELIREGKLRSLKQ